MKDILVTILIFTGLNLYSQSVELFSGINYGGALPSEKIENSKGSGCLGLSLGTGINFEISKKFMFSPSLSYELRRFKYTSQEHNDTVVSVDMFGSPASLPTYYTAFVSGKPLLHYATLNLPIKLYYNEKMSLNFGIYYGFAFVGKDITEVLVQIGEGGVIDDQYIEQDNWDKINKHEIGLSLGGSYNISERIDITLRAHRSLTPFYDENHIKNSDGQNVNFYSTGVQLTINYQIPHRMG